MYNRICENNLIFSLMDDEQLIYIYYMAISIFADAKNWNKHRKISRKSFTFIHIHIHEMGKKSTEELTIRWKKMP